MESTGIRNLDAALGGGLAVPSGILLFGPMGCGKTTLGRQLVANFLAKDYSVMYVTIEDEAETAKLELEEIDVNVEKQIETGQLYFLDLFSQAVENLNATPTRDSIIHQKFLELINGNFLDTVRGFSLKNLSRKQFRFMDSITPMLLSASDAEIYQFSQTFQNLLKFVNGVGVATFDKDVLGKKTENLLLDFADVIIRMTRKNELTGREVEGGGFLRVIRTKDQGSPTQPIYYSLERNRISFPDISSTLDW